MIRKQNLCRGYRNYEHINGHGNDENIFYDDLLTVIDSILDVPLQTCTRSIGKSIYANDKVVQGWNKLLRKAQSNWSKNPGDNQSKETMMQIADGSYFFYQDYWWCVE